MIVKLNSKQYEFLNSTLAIEKPELFKNLLHSAGLSIVISDDVAISICDWVGDRLINEGFDENYELNERGKILEQLEDLFNS